MDGWIVWIVPDTSELLLFGAEGGDVGFWILEVLLLLWSEEFLN